MHKNCNHLVLQELNNISSIWAPMHLHHNCYHQNLSSNNEDVTSPQTHPSPPMHPTPHSQRMYWNMNFQEVHDTDLWLLLQLERSDPAPLPVSGQDGDPYQKWLHLMPDLALQLEGGSIRLVLLPSVTLNPHLRGSHQVVPRSISSRARSSSRTTIASSPSSWGPPIASSVY